jgi:hypothetical protein
LDNELLGMLKCISQSLELLDSFLNSPKARLKMDLKVEFGTSLTCGPSDELLSDKCKMDKMNVELSIGSGLEI